MRILWVDTPNGKIDIDGENYEYYVESRVFKTGENLKEGLEREWEYYTRAAERLELELVAILLYDSNSISRLEDDGKTASTLITRYKIIYKK
jgi:hypothetical protein